MNSYVCGFDLGNSDTALYIAPDCRLILPSYTAYGSFDRLQSIDYHLQPGDYVYGNGSEQYVGSLALHQGKHPESGRGDPARYWSNRALVLLLTASAALLQNEQEYSLEVRTGLPVMVYLASQEHKRKVKAALEGTHAFTINGQLRRAHVTVSHVLMEGAGVVVSSKVKGKVGVIDVGGFTTDVYVSSNKVPTVHQCNGFNLGVSEVGSRLSEMFYHAYGRRLDDDEQRTIPRAVIDKKLRLTPIMSDGTDRTTQAKELAAQAIESVGREIAAKIARLWNEDGTIAGTFSRVFLMGGGAYYFASFLHDILPNVERVPEPEYGNARGYSEV